jgi:hypothetical protein
MTWLKSALALFAGFVLVVALSIGADLAVMAAGYSFEQPAGLSADLLLLATLYRCVFGTAGSAVAAFLAPRAPMLHAMILGGIGLAANLYGTIMQWHLGAHWYPIALTVLTLPCAWLGGVLAGARGNTA